MEVSADMMALRPTCKAHNSPYVIYLLLSRQFSVQEANVVQWTTVKRVCVASSESTLSLKLWSIDRVSCVV